MSAYHDPQPPPPPAFPIVGISGFRRVDRLAQLLAWQRPQAASLRRPAPAMARDWVRIPVEVASPRMLAVLLNVSTRCVLYWRTGQRTPRLRNRRKLLMLQAPVWRLRDIV